MKQNKRKYEMKEEGEKERKKKRDKENIRGSWHSGLRR